MPQTDEQFALQVRRGDIESFSVLVDRYEAKMARYARKFVVDRDDISDLVQDVFIKAYENIRSFDVSRKFSPWLYRIAHNTFVNALKSKSRFRLVDIDTLFPHPVASECADRDVNERELLEALEQCLDRVDAKYREPLVLHYLQELGYQEISEVLRIPVATVGVRLHRGRQILRKRYDELQRSNHE